MGTTSFVNGQFCWWDLGAPDQAASKAFYHGLFGWNPVDSPMGPDEYYTTFMVGDASVCATYTQRKDMQEQGVPPFWLSYINVDDVDATTAKVADAGGVVIAPPFDVMNVGRMSMIQDPSGAGVALWQAATHSGAGLINEVNSNCWNELATTDAEKAKDFFGKVLGWTFEVMPMPTGEYTIIKSGETTVGGLMQMTGEWGNVPSHWMPYFAVADCDASNATTGNLGGQTVVPPTDIPGVGRFAVLKDPQGAHFSVLQPVPMEAQ
ncbi:MAG TPA: VOC family protein [Candidatus Kapabacteria bacterium]|nr:VOC family protein [Candidatus Kapabacteria bacterium]